MIISSLNAIVLVFFIDDAMLANNLLDPFSARLMIAILLTTVGWIVTTFVTKPENAATLRRFYRLTHPGGPGWKKVIEEAESDGDMIDEKNKGLAWEMPIQILCVFVGIVSIYAFLFGIGNFVYLNPTLGFILLGVGFAGTYILFKLFSKLRTQ
jgi:hypothetical protein